MNLDHWLGSLGLSQYAELFRSNEIDDALLIRLTNDDLKEIGVEALGHRKKLLEAIAALDASHSASSPLPGMTAAGTAPDRYTPEHLAAKILTSKSAVEGERKQVTVLFADLKGSMELLAERDPEEARKILDPVIERMMEAVHHYEGTVNQVMGDGIMALFGAPLTHEDHAVRACYAALRMQQAIKRYAEETRRSVGLEIQIRVGLNSGEVVVRSIGSDLRMDYTAVGQTTHLAARMEQSALPGTVRLTAATVRLAEGYVEVKSLGPSPVKGLPEPIEIFELVGTGAARTRLQAAALRGLTSFVGRDAEVEHLRRVLGQADAGHGQVVAIVGEAGVGKSRLVHEFTHSHRVQDWLILDAPSVSYGEATSYLPVIDLLKGYFKIGVGDDHREMRDKVLGRVLGLDRALEPLLTPLLALLDVPLADATWQDLDPPQRRRRTLDAVKRLLLRESLVQPLLLVFEDLHWVDGETQALLDNLVDGLGTARLLLLVNYRPEYEHRWGSKTAYSQLRLDRLATESAAELLVALLGPDPGLTPLSQMLVKRGNPFFLEETVRTLVETGALEGDRGAYRLTRPVETLKVPATVQTILAARIDRLAPEEKQLLQAASAIGKDVHYSLLASIAGLTDEGLQGGLAHLQEAEFLYETQAFPSLEYTFKHALTHDVTYAGLLGDRRLQLHAQIVSAIERLHADRLAEYVERLAHHSMRGQLWDKAAHYGRQAGLRALDRSAPREALVAFEQAQVALRGTPESQERTERLIDTSIDQREAHFRLGESARLGDVLREARRLAEGLDDQRRLARVLVLQASHQTFLSEHRYAIEAAQRACAVAERTGELGPRFVAKFILGQALWFAGESRRASAPLHESLALLIGVPITERFGRPMLAAVSARFHLPGVLADLGEFARAIAIGEEAVCIAESLADPLNEIFARNGLANAHLRQGNFSQAAKSLAPALRSCKTLEIPFLMAFTTAGLGAAYLGSGRQAEAVRLLEQGLEAFKEMQIFSMRSFYMSVLAEGYLALGRPMEAHERVEQAVELAHAHQEGGWEGWCLKVLGDICAQKPSETEQAATAYRQALTIATELGMRPLEAHCRFGLSKLHAGTGEREEGKAQLTSALTMFREMEMLHWLERAELDMKALT